MKDFSEINDLVESVECRMQDAYEQGYETGHKDGEARGIDKMNNLSKEAYAKGLEDAWECAKKIVLRTDKGGIDAKDLLKIFDVRSVSGILESVSINDAMQKIKEYEEQQKRDERKVDCEVTACYNCVNHGACDYEYEKKQTDATDICDGSIKVGDKVINGDVVGVVIHVREIENGMKGMKAFTVMDKTGKVWNFNGNF